VGQLICVGIGFFSPLLAAPQQQGEAVAAHGPQSILPYSYRGNNGVYQSNAIDRRFFHALGASTFARTICAGGLYGALAYSDVFFGFAPEGLVESKLIIFWASNPLNTGLHVWPLVQEARRRGAKLIAIDPYRSRTARLCDEHVFLRPGTDAALALGKTSRRVFLSLGRQELHCFAAFPQHRYIARLIEPPQQTALPHGLVLLQQRGPFDIDAELRLLRERKIDVIVSRNSGGSATYPKIEAARVLGLPVVMIARRAKPIGHVVKRPEAAVAWLAHGTPRSPRGV